MSWSRGRPSGAPRDVLTRACRILAAGGFVTVALLGAAVSAPMTVLVLGPVSGVVVAGLVALTAEGPLRYPSPLRVFLAAAGAGLLVFPYVAGVALLGSLGAVVTLALLVLGAVPGVTRMARARHPRGSGAFPGTTAGPPADPTDLMATGRLLEEWRSSSAQLRDPDPARRLEAVELRAVLLEELARRHPAALGRWLTDGGGAGPQRDSGDDRVT